MSSWSDWFGGDDSKTSTQTTTSQLTPLQEQSQQILSNYLKGLSSSNLYGATDINWDDIWSETSKKINQAYYGSPTSSGLIGKVKASAARRGVSESPALEYQVGKLGVQANQDLASALSDLTTKKASYTEQARNNWLNALRGTSTGTPTSTTTTSTTPTTDNTMIDILSLLGKGTGSLIGSYTNPLSSIWQKLLSGNTTQDSITGEDVGLTNTSNDTLMNILKSIQA